MRNSTLVTSLDVTHCSNVACTNATTTAIDSGVGAGTSIAIGSDGLAPISYQKRDGLLSGAAGMAHCSNVACMSATVTTESAPAGGWSGSDKVGASSSVTVNGNGLGLVTFVDTSNAEDYSAQCHDLACTSFDNGADLNVGASSTADSVVTGDDGRGQVAILTGFAVVLWHCTFPSHCLGTDQRTGLGLSGSGVSLTVGPRGQPIVAASKTGGPTQVEVCADVRCTNGDLTQFVAGTGSAFVSVTVGTDGLPIIASYDDGDHALVVSHCTNTLCLPYFRRP